MDAKDIIKPLPDTESFQIMPTVEAMFRVGNVQELDELKIEIPISFNREQGEYMSTLFYFDDQDINQNKIQVQKVNDGDYKLEWTGVYTRCELWWPCPGCQDHG